MQLPQPGQRRAEKSCVIVDGQPFLDPFHSFGLRKRKEGSLFFWRDLSLVKLMCTPQALANAHEVLEHLRSFVRGAH